MTTLTPVTQNRHHGDADHSKNEELEYGEEVFLLNLRVTCFQYSLSEHSLKKLVSSNAPVFKLACAQARNKQTNIQTKNNNFTAYIRQK